MKELGQKILFWVITFLACLSFLFYLSPILGMAAVIQKYGFIQGIIKCISLMIPFIGFLLFLGILIGDFSKDGIVLRLLQRFVRRVCGFVVSWISLDYLIHINENYNKYENWFNQFIGFVLDVIVFVFFITISIRGVMRDYCIMRDALQYKRRCKCSFKCAMLFVLDKELEKTRQ